MRRLVNQRLFEHGLTGLRCERGTASLEVALVAVVLLVVSVGAVDFGRYAYTHLTLTSAARAGAQYGIQDQGTAGESAEIVQAARDDAGDDTLNVAARQFCECPGAGETGCGTACADGNYPTMYVEVSVSDELKLLFDYPGVDSPLPVAVRSRIRVR